MLFSSFAGSVAGLLQSVLSFWIVGHSLVKWAAKQGDTRPCGKNLGFSFTEVSVNWWGKGV